MNGEYCQPKSLPTVSLKSPFPSVSITANDEFSEFTKNEQISATNETMVSNSECGADSTEEEQCTDASANAMIFSSPVMIRVLPMDMISNNVNTVERIRRFDKIVAALPRGYCIRRQLEKGFSNLRRSKPPSSCSSSSSTTEKAKFCQSSDQPADCGACCSASVCRDGNTILKKLLGPRKNRPLPSTFENSSAMVSE